MSRSQYTFCHTIRDCMDHDESSCSLRILMILVHEFLVLYVLQAFFFLVYYNYIVTTSKRRHSQSQNMFFPTIVKHKIPNYQSCSINVFVDISLKQKFHIFLKFNLDKHDYEYKEYQQKRVFFY